MKYLFTRIIFISSLVLIWFVFVYQDWFPDLDQKLTYILASFGVTFGVFQYFINHIKEKEKWLNEKRLEEYRKIRDLIQDFINTVNNGLSDNSTPIETENALINIKNEIAVCINSNDPIFFPGLKDSESSKKLDNCFSQIILNTSKARQEHQRILNSLTDSKIISLEVLKMNWGISVRDLLKDSFRFRDTLIKKIQDYIST